MSELAASGRIQTIALQVKQQRWPIMFISVVVGLFSWYITRAHYVDKYTLGSAEYVEINNALFQENQDLINQIDIINDAHANAMQGLDDYEKQLAGLENQEPIYIEKVKYIQPQACHFQEIPEELRNRINEAIVSYYR